MDRVDDASPDERPSGPRTAAVLAAILAAAALLCLLWMTTDLAARIAGALPASLVLFVLASLLGAVAVGWASMRERHLTTQLREARASLQRLEELIDVWQWRTDPQHRLVALRPPVGAAEADWSAMPLGATLWEHFRVDDEPALRAQLAGAAPLQDIEVRRAGATVQSRAGSSAGALAGGPTGRLRGRPLSDALGAFAGYAGTLREVAAVTELTAVTAVTDLAPAPVIVVAGPAEAPKAAPVPAPTPAPAAAPSPRPGSGVADSEHESFGYTVSHDLRAPIRVVEGFTKIVKEDYGRLLDRVGNDHLDRVLGAAARMNSMIDALLALSKLSSQPLAHQPVNLSQLAGYVSEDLRRQWPDRNVRIEIQPGLQVLGDPTLLRVVLENLLGNAWKYTGKCAEAHIWFERGADEPDVFTVRDDGAGFDMRFSDRLFGVFQRLHSANDFPGTGVGLASVRRIVRRHGGEIWGEAEVNKGARFHFSLPQAAAKPPA